ncbi:MAG: Nif3-like dinuclear metal center hexameric protein, partial [Alistipes sp.]|nr:Nif3-like dinuclear metal center hexameric protein [Alistipes sp.]
MKVRDITERIESFAPLALQESYDNAGLIVGRYDNELTGGVLLAVDVTDEVIDEALEKGCGMIITHHPIVFNAMKRFNSASLVERCVERAIKHDIALYACHTNLDAAVGGMSWRLGTMLGVENMQALEAGTDGTGFGVVGDLAQPMAVEEFFAILRSTLGCKAVRHSKVVKSEIQRIAICTG